MGKTLFSYEFNRQVSDSVKGGMTLKETAARYGCSINAVFRACKKFGVKAGNSKSASVKSFAVLKDLLSGLRASSIAERHGISQQRVSQIKLAACEAGWQFLWDKEGKG